MMLIPSSLKSTARALSLALAGVCLLITACSGQGGPTAVPTELGPEGAPTQVILTPPPWREASEPITLENIASMERLGALSVPEGSGTVFGYTLSADNTQLAALNESWLMAWDLVSGQPLYQTSRQDEIQLFYSPTKETLYGVTGGGGVYLHDSATGTEIDSIPEPTAYADAGFSGAYDYHLDTASLALGLENGDIVVWELIDGEEPQILPNTEADSRILDVDFSGDSETLAAVYNVEANNRIALWNWRDGTALREITTRPAETGTITEIALSPDGRFLVGLGTNTVVAWDTATGQQLHTLAGVLGGGSLLFRFIPDSSLVLIGGIEANIQIWDVESGNTLTTLPETGGDPESIAPIGAAVSPDRQMMLTSKMDSSVALWNLSNLGSGNIGRNAQPFGSPSIFDVLWTNDSFAVLMIDARGPVEVWGIP